MMREWVASHDSVRASTHHAMARFIDYAEANPNVMRLLQRVELQAEEAAPEFNVVATRDLHLQLITELVERGIRAGEIRDGVDPYDCALVIAGTMSFHFEFALYTSRWERERIHRTIDLVFDGIGA